MFKDQNLTQDALLKDGGHFSRGYNIAGGELAGDNGRSWEDLCDLEANKIMRIYGFIKEIRMGNL